MMEVYTEDDQTVRVTEGPYGLRAVCECGWSGQWRADSRRAESDAMDHALDHSIRLDGCT
jgi:hypothetical protein